MKIRVLVVPLNEYGRRIGELHHNARISDATVDLIREMHEDDGRTCRYIAETLQIRWATVRKIVYYQRRAQTAAKWKRIRLSVPVSN